MTQTLKSKRLKLEKMQRECEAWNRKYPIGTDVLLNKDFVDELVPTKTRSKASILSGHSVVIWLDGVSGCYLLSHVTPQKPLKT